MDADVVHEVGVSLNDVNGLNSSDPEVDSSKIDLIVETSSYGETFGALRSVGEVLTRVELDLARASEKLINLNVLTMNVATKESDFEAFALEKEDMTFDSLETALESDILSGFLDSEVSEVDTFLTNLQTEVGEARDMISPYANLGETFIVMDEKLHNSEESLKQSKDQISEIREQSAKFHQSLSCLYRKENSNDDEGEHGHLLNMKPQIKMQTVEQQRHILRMLEKSLARELDLEKKLAESRQVEQELNHKLHFAEQERFLMEEEANDICERYFAAENAAEVFMGISKELLGRVQILQFNLNSYMKREIDLGSKLEKFNQQLEAKETALQKFNSSSSKLNDFLLAQTDSLKASLSDAEHKLVLANCEAFTLGEKVCLLENQLKEYEQPGALCSKIPDMENLIEDLKEKLSKAESRAQSAETKCALLTESNMELSEELGHLKDTYGKVDSLERQLRESDIKLQHAVALADASQEQQNMLYSTVKDMESLIEGLKLKVSKAESQADSAEDKCIILSESNAMLNDELSFLRGKLECLETSLNQAEETKMATAKDIGFRTKVITNLIMQLAIERERLHKQISSLALENRTLIANLRQTGNQSFEVTKCRSKDNGKHHLISGNENIQNPTTGTEMEKDVSSDEAKVGGTGLMSDLENVRRIDIGVLSLKQLTIAMFFLLTSVALYCFIAENRP